MVIEDIIDYIFYEESPDCLLLGIGVYDETACETISKSFDVLFYAVFATLSALVFTRLVKMCIIFMKVIKYLFIIRRIDESMVRDKNTSRKIFIWMNKLHACNEGFFGVGKRTICSLNVLSKLESHMEDMCDIFKGGIKIRMKEIFMVLLEKCKSRANAKQRTPVKEILPVELIFINHKYCRKTGSSQIQLTDQNNEMKQKIGFNTKIDPEHTEVDSTTSTTVPLSLSNRMNISIESIEQKLRRGSFDCRNKYFRKIFHMMPVLTYPTIVLEKRHMRYVVKRYSSTNITNSTNRQSKQSNSSINDGRTLKLKDRCNMSDTSTDFPSECSDLTHKFFTTKEKVKEIKRRNLIKYLKSLNTNRKTNTIFSLQGLNFTSSNQSQENDDLFVNNKPFKRQKRKTTDLYDYTPQENGAILKMNMTNSQCVQRAKWNTNNKNNGDQITLWSSCNNKTINIKSPDCRDINRGLTLPRYQSKVIKTNKIRKSSANVCLDVIHENSS